MRFSCSEDFVINRSRRYFQKWLFSPREFNIEDDLKCLQDHHQTIRREILRGFKKKIVQIGFEMTEKSRKHVFLGLGGWFIKGRGWSDPVSERFRG